MDLDAADAGAHRQQEQKPGREQEQGQEQEREASTYQQSKNLLIGAQAELRWHERSKGLGQQLKVLDISYLYASVCTSEHFLKDGLNASPVPFTSPKQLSCCAQL